MKNLFLLCLLAWSYCASSQTPMANLIYMDEITGSSLDSKCLTAADPENNFLLGASYLNNGTQSLVVQGDTLLSALNTSADVVLLKMNPEGQLVWMKRIESTQEILLQGLVADQTGHIILRFSHFAEASLGNMTFAPGITLLKLDPAGLYEWHNTLTGIYSPQFSNMLTLDCEGNIITGGNTSLHSTGVPIDTFIWFPDTIVQYQLAPDSVGVSGTYFPPPGYHNMVILKFLPDGSLLWQKQYPGEAFLSEMSAEFGTDIVMSGHLRDDSLALDNVTLVKNDTAGGPEFFYAKFDENCTAKWAGIYFKDAYTWDVRTAPDGSVYAGAEFYETATYQNTTIQGNGLQDILLFKLDSSGVFQWARNVGDAFTNQIAVLSVNKKGEVVVASLTVNTSEMGRKYDPQGNLLWINPDNGDLGNNRSGPVVFDSEGSMWLVGWFNGDFSMGPYEFSVWGGPAYVFIAKFSDQDIPGPFYTCTPTSATAAPQIQDAAPVRLSPNPAEATVEISGPAVFSKIRIFTADGKCLADFMPLAEPTVIIPLDSFEPGLLFIDCIDVEGRHSLQKCVKL